jgi:membrane fusion protein (multidrug efflux system)
MAHEESNVKPFEPQPAPEPAAPPATGKDGGSALKRIVTWTLLAGLLAAAALFGLKRYRFYETHEETDDAQVEAHLSPVLARVAGYVAEIRVDDNQSVTAGEPLLTIDPGDLLAKAHTASASVESARAGVAVARANAQAAATAHVKAESDWSRYRALREKEEVSKLQADAAKAAAEATGAQGEASDKQIAAAESLVAQKRADLELANLQLAYTKVTSPAAGTVAKKNVEVWQFVQAGQPLMAIVSQGAPWIVANFKETQLKKMRVGQRVDVTVDAYPGVTFPGKVESISAATGAKFALLPPDNATGNFTKVVQRVPVKVVLTGPADPQRPLRAGMSVDVVVHVS